MACKVPFFILFLRKEKSGKEVSEKQLEMEKRKSKTANSNLRKLSIVIRCFHSNYLSSGGLETEN